MKNTANFEKLVSVMDVVLKVAQIVLIIAVSVLFVFDVLSYVLPAVFPNFDMNKFADTGSVDLVFGSLKLSFQPESVSWYQLQVFITSMFASVLVTAALLYTTILFLRKILAEVKIRTPFSNTSISSLKVLGWLIIAGSVIYGLPENVSQIATAHLFNVESILVSAFGDVAPIVSVDLFSFNVSILIAGLLVLLLGGIFEYGKKLQDEIDETV